MPVYQLSKQLVFPPPVLAEKDGLLAMGGDLSSERILYAYRNGIFPWYSEGMPILWWSPDPRCVLYPEKLKISKSMKQVLRKKQFEVTFNKDFEAVLKNCKNVERPGQEGTWITPEMEDAYLQLHMEGHAQSVEVWKEGELVGGLYGISLGKCFFGESMFARASNASKVGFIELVKLLKTKGYKLIDCQVTTRHLMSLGAEEISRDTFLSALKSIILT